MPLVKVAVAEKAFVRKARRNPAYFIWYITGLKPTKQHLQWLQAIFDPKSKYTNIIAYPGSGKTHILERSFAWLIGAMPWLTNALISVSTDQAKARLKTVRDIIEHEPRYKNVFPHIELDPKKGVNAHKLNVWSRVWRNPHTGVADYEGEEIPYNVWRSLIGRYGDLKGDTLITGSVTSQNIIGIRCSGIMGIDDPHNSKNSGTTEQINKVYHTITYDLLSRLTAINRGNYVADESKAVVISTRWVEDDTAGRLKKLERDDGSLVWKTYETPIVDEDGNVNIPEITTPKQVQDIKERSGGESSPVFQLAYMCNPMGGATGEIVHIMLKKDIPADFNAKEMKQLVISVDFAHTEKKGSDWTVYTAIARDKLSPFNVYMLDMMRFKKQRMTDKADLLKEFADKIFMAYECLDGILFEERDSQHEIETIRERYPDLPLKVVKTKGNKEIRFNILAPRIQQGRFYMNQAMKHAAATQTELLGFPSAIHDDIVDSLTLPFQQIGWSSGRIKSKLKPMRLPALI